MTDVLSEPTVIVEVGFTVGASTGTYLHLGDTSRGKLGTGTLAPDNVWTDVSASFQSGAIVQASTRLDGPVVGYETGTAAVVLEDLDRRYDPTNLSGPYVSAGVTQVTPMRAVRIRATWAGTTYDLWRGFADDWQIAWSDPSATEVTLTGSDAFKVLSGISRTAVAAVGASENTGARVSRILDSAGWAAADRVIAAGDSTLQVTTLDAGVLDELQAAVLAELGELYIDGAGRVVFRNRNAPFTDARSSTSQATFGDNDGELPYTALTISTDDATRYNDVRITRDGGTEQAVTDSASIQMYLRRTYEQTGLLLEDDTTALSWAQWVLYVSKDPELRFVEIEIDPRLQPDDLYPQVLGRQRGDRITIIRRPPWGGAPIQRDVFIRGITHEFKQGEWTTKWQLQSASKYGSFLVLGNSTLGVLGSNALGY